MGKGYSVKRGMMNATGAFVLFSDADLSTPISELTKFSEGGKKDEEERIGNAGE